MPEYMRRPVMVTAYQFDGSERMAKRLHEWHVGCKGATTPILQTEDAMRKALTDPNHRASMRYDPTLGVVEIATVDGGVLELTPGDWLVHSPSHSFVKMTNEDFQEEHSPERESALAKSQQLKDSPLKDSPRA